MYKKKNIQQYNKEEVNHCKKNKNNKYNINMEILSSIKSMLKSCSIHSFPDLIKIFI